MISKTRAQQPGGRLPSRAQRQNDEGWKESEAENLQRLGRIYQDEEEQILLALAQIQVVDGLLYEQANEAIDSKKDSALNLLDMASSACRLTQASLDTFERLNVVQLVVNARAEKMRGRP